jgi:hypothetical protein
VAVATPPMWVNQATVGLLIDVRSAVKKYGAIAESSLNMTVWDALSEALLHPNVMAEAIQEISAPSNSVTEGESEEIRLGLKQIKAEESRVLEAYRLEILTADQLAREMEELRTRTSLLESRESALARRQKADKTLVLRSLEEYRQVVAGRLAILTVDERRRLLRLLLRAVVFEGDRVTIRGIIPMGNDSPSPAGAAVTGQSPDPGRIANLTSWHCVRNDALERTASMLAGPGPYRTMSFDLMATVKKDTTASRAAMLRNLIKANEALKRMREAG